MVQKGIVFFCAKNFIYCLLLCWAWWTGQAQNQILLLI